MFDIGFSEMMVVAVVALIVIGPERLPKVARTLGHLFGRMQRYVNDVKSDISREMELEELRKLQATVEDAARAIETSVTKEVSATESELNKLATDVSATAPALAEPPVVANAGSDVVAETSAPVQTVASQLEAGLESAPASPPPETVSKPS